ncbi:MAG: hypothetical protein HZB91_00210 [Elusimicrobia bacterium]|nr:hypothetical protein [Elusimicrobiota bacterium]
MARPEIIDYIRKLKGQFPDDEIRRQLLKDGVSFEEVDDAFRIAASMVAPAAEGRPRSSKAPLVFLFVAVMTLVLVGILRKASHIGGSDAPKQDCEVSDDQQAQVEEEIKGHSPALHAYPSNVDPFLPAELAEGDAAPALLAAVKAALEAGGPAMIDGLAVKGYKLPEGVAAAAMPKLEEGLRFGDNLMTGGSLVPRTYAEAGSMGVVAVILVRLCDPYLEQAEAFLKEGRLAEAEAQAKKAMALGMLLMKDWSTVSRAMGAALILDGYGVIRRAQEKAIDKEAGLDCVVRKMEVAKVTGMLGKELKNFMMQPSETAVIARLAASPKELPGLQKYLDSPTLRQVYAAHVLLGVAEAWSPSEILAGAPDPARQGFLEAAAKHKDPRLAALANGFSAAFNELRGIYAKLPLEDRKTAVAGKPVLAMAAHVPATSADRHALLLGLLSR